MGKKKTKTKTVYAQKDGKFLQDSKGKFIPVAKVKKKSGVSSAGIDAALNEIRMKRYAKNNEAQS